MDTKGRSIDNIVKRVSGEHSNMRISIHKATKQSRKIRAKISEYIDIYNKKRVHSISDYHTPNKVYYKGANSRRYNAKEIFERVA